ncbi:GTP cyclohydrolase subunit MoaA [Caballeronia pedi]|uniref:GTP 3',8-cyclase n=1 Tax=Caballeronia pedi TaxID=1777141 RepID=A0A158CLW0_9BURK|nr:GTP 3',8-cyclase MoaA [Caballeronia pedi]SAK83292.1 GTP cyclohydrolase subunit MoaA [Caballeronia pedi]
MNTIALPPRPLDTRGRALKDLRLSVIDQCNFRCSYCMPKDVFTNDYPFLSSDAWLSFDQLFALSRAFAQLGVEKIRLTGGEPLLRKGIETLIQRLATLDIDIALTTNGSLLAAKAHRLRHAGLRRVTVSLDAIDDDLFGRMNGVGFPVARVLEGIDAAIDAGLLPLKINVVMEKGVNESQILPLARHFHRRPVDLRFIEYMDVGGAHAWTSDKVVPSDQILALLKRHFALEPETRDEPESTSVNHRFANGLARVGFVSSMSKPFCSSCSRARVSVDGQLYSCLFATQSFDLKPWLGPSLSLDELANAIRTRWMQRDDRYSELRNAMHAHASRKRYPTVRMSLVGG